MLQIHVRKLIQFCHKINPEYIAKISNSFMPANKKANCSVSLFFRVKLTHFNYGKNEDLLALENIYLEERIQAQKQRE